jgi:hypothetical protein
MGEEKLHQMSHKGRGGRNIENHNIKGSERRNFFYDDQNVECQKQNQKSLRRKHDQKSFKTFDKVIFPNAKGNF